MLFNLVSSHLSYYVKHSYVTECCFVYRHRYSQSVMSNHVLSHSVYLTILDVVYCCTFRRQCRFPSNHQCLSVFTDALPSFGVHHNSLHCCLHCHLLVVFYRYIVSPITGHYHSFRLTLQRFIGFA